MMNKLDPQMAYKLTNIKEPYRGLIYNHDITKSAQQMISQTDVKMYSYLYCGVSPVC